MLHQSKSRSYKPVRRDELNFGGALRGLVKAFASAHQLATADGRRERKALLQLHGIKILTSGLVAADLSRRYSREPVAMQGMTDNNLDIYKLKQILQLDCGGIWQRLVDRNGSIPVHSESPLPKYVIVKGNIKYLPNREPYLEVIFSEDKEFLYERETAKAGPGSIQNLRQKMRRAISSLKEEIKRDPRIAFDQAQEAIEKQSGEMA